MNELETARAIASGQLSSPQRFAGFVLWAIRITSTGAAERVALGEKVWRPPELWLNAETLARVAALPVIGLHPDESLDSAEYDARSVGTVQYTYIADETGLQNDVGPDVWAVCRLYNESMIDVLAKNQWSTSPSVVFGKNSDNKTIFFEDGSKLLVEATPDLLCHIAIVPNGVWDRGGPPNGVRSDANFVEGEHPREADGKFTEGAGSSRAALKETKTEGGKRVQASGQPLPPHIEKIKLPPAWTDVRYSDDPKADLLAVGRDSKGRVQSVYSEAFSATQAAAKFDRIEELRGKFGYIADQNAEAQKSANAKIADSADCLDLIMKMGVRPGSETDTGAKVKAYGATTLEGRHVVKTDAGVSLRFVGKKGVSLDLPVHDKALAGMLIKRASDAGAEGKLFSATNDKALLDHVHTLDGGGFKTKDFRTHVGTSTAYALVAKQSAPKTEADYKRAVMTIAKEVSKKLGNTPVIALQSYISPAVFAEWRAAL